MIAVTLAGCSGHDDTIQNCIVLKYKLYFAGRLGICSTTGYAERRKNSFFASVYFIESPKGMEYTVKWYLDGAEIKNRDKSHR